MDAMRLNRIPDQQVTTTLSYIPIPNNRFAYHPECLTTAKSGVVQRLIPDICGKVADHSIAQFVADGQFLTMRLVCECCMDSTRKMVKDVERHEGYVSSIHREKMALIKDLDKVRGHSRRKEKPAFLWIATTPGRYIVDDEDRKIHFLAESGDLLGSLDISPEGKITYEKVNNFARQFCKERI